MLGFNTVEWPDVFARQMQPIEMSNIETVRLARQVAEDAHNKQLGLAGTRVPWIAAAVGDFLEEDDDAEPWKIRLTRSMCKFSANIGVRLFYARTVRMPTLSSTPVEGPDAITEADDSID